MVTLGGGGDAVQPESEDDGWGEGSMPGRDEAERQDDEACVRRECDPGLGETSRGRHGQTARLNEL